MIDYSFAFEHDGKNGDYTTFMYNYGIRHIALMWLDGNGIELSSIYRSNDDGGDILQFDINANRKLNVVGIDVI